jgi:hypothetical protein
MDTFFVKGPNDLNTREGRRKIIKKEFRFSNFDNFFINGAKLENEGAGHENGF